MNSDVRNPNSEIIRRPIGLLLIRASNIVSSFVIRASSFLLRIGRLWIQLRFWREIVVDRYRHPVAQFENARAHNCLVAFESVRNGDEIAAGFTDADELLPNGS